MKKQKNFFIFSFFSFWIVLNILAFFVFLDLNKKEKLLKVVFFDVGQGEAIFIETPQNHQILIDGGPDSKILNKLANQMSFWDRTIDLIILTHPERDHLAGLLNVLERYKVENIVWTGVKRNTNEFKEWQEKILKEKANIVLAQAGQKIIAKNAVFKILYPFESLKDKEIENSNETSIVSQLIFGKNAFMFSGDIGKSIEEKLVREYSCFESCKFARLDSDVLKVAHHGSKNSTSRDFVEKVLPKIAVISAGKNNIYGHPHQEVLEILKNYDIKIMRTDLEGDIKIISDGNNLKIKNF